MQEFSVSLDIISTDSSLKDLTAQLGLEPSEASHDRGSPRARKSFWEETVWRLESDASASASLEVHCQDLLAKARAAGVLESIRRLQKAEALINIAAFFDTAMCTVTIPRVCLEAIRDYSFGLQVTCYPSDMDG